eukprot:COSAG06_NODE_4862_length_3896_cov_24.255728_5_plen_98_part_00
MPLTYGGLLLLAVLLFADFEGGKISLEVTVPPNVAATVHVPTTTASKSDSDGVAAIKTPPPVVMESGSVLEGGRQEDGSVVFEVGSGHYRFTTDYVH